MSAEDCEWSISGATLADLLQDVLRKGAPFTFQARGFSMSSLIRDSDNVSLFPMNGISPGLGDVVAFVHKGSGMPLLHRFVGKKGNTYLPKGDNATATDGFIAESDILGCVLMVERKGLRVFFGLGPERFLIAYLNRRGILLTLILMLRKLRLFVWFRDSFWNFPHRGEKEVRN